MVSVNLRLLNLLLLVGLFHLNFGLMAQINDGQFIGIQADSIYQANIKKTRLYGVYIPKDIPDALLELDKLSTPEAQAKLKLADENTIGKKLRFGLGRWMEYNWNFQEGSRFSHYLKGLGLWHPDDMVEFMTVIYYRHVSGKNLNEIELSKTFVEQREAWMKAKEKENTVEISRKQKEKE